MIGANKQSSITNRVAVNITFQAYPQNAGMLTCGVIVNCTVLSFIMVIKLFRRVFILF